MKILVFIALLFVTILFTNCKKNATVVVEGNYSYLHFVTAGGGQIDFNAYPSVSTNEINITVSAYSYRDTSIQIVLEKTTENSAAFTSYYMAINAQVKINGDFHQSTLPTGTWSYIYCEADGKETEITNIELRNILLTLGQLVRSKITEK